MTLEQMYDLVRHIQKNRALYRPVISFKIVIYKILLSVLVDFFICVILWTVSKNISNRFMTMLNKNVVWVFALILITYIIVHLKLILIWLIKVYQSKAPDHVRNACVFEPTCSVYMILVLNKYGVIIGLYKGIRRLLRCRLPNGGYDYP